MSGLAVTDLTVRSEGRVLLSDVTFTLEKGEILWILGPSGSGKTTLLRALAGIETFDAGRIDVGGRTVASRARSLPPEGRRVGLVFQDASLFPHLTASGNVAFGLNGHPRRRVRELLERVDLVWAGDRYPHTLSGGERQRVALARALAPDPDVVLFDEPFSGLDPELRSDLAETECRILRNAGKTAVFVGHNPEDAMRFADRIAILRAGRLLQVGAPLEVYRDPANAFCAGQLGPVNRLRVTVRKCQVETPFGTLSADGYADGEVDLLIRDEGVRLDTNGIRARICGVRPLGALALLELDIGHGWKRIRARIPAGSLDQDEGNIRISLDPSRVFLFPCDPRELRR